jgi:site-specific recombinase XerD
MARAADSTRRDRDVLGDAEIVALIGACSNRAPTGIRNRALIAVMWRCGLRIGEALALERKDVDLNHGVLSVQHGKGDKARKVGLDTTTSALVARWIDKRRALGFNGRNTPLFCTLAGGKIEQAYVRGLLRRLAKKAGVEGRVHPHGLRHSFAAGMARRGASMTIIRDALGHTSIAVTDRYLREVAPVDVVEAMQEREWSL